ncbi:cobalamin-binding protein [Noviherbaspirillum denitrificans]|uniref:Cobalamin-binding protein n=1 Tax=Noviherbaspirillum denitrificans TaxID=1968433 RepID=A0A254TJF2_9BURK|nr:cobalamin-binding protein [Noviherbaspirillum denitrificans]OWW19838.1 cobalamin-binding protein [Noviherbaspirillum denitrificans]
MKRLLLALACAMCAHAHAAITVTDDDGQTITLQQPARRVVSLAPHVTEMLFAAGGGDRIVGTVKYSDYPSAARDIPRVGDNRLVDIERLLALKPDLLVVWRHNASSRQMEQLRKLGIPLFYSEPHKLDEIPLAILKMGQLMGTTQQAEKSAAELRAQLDSLTARYRNRPPVRVFYQVWDRPLYTLNERHIINDAIHICGGENIFAKLPLVAPSLSPEAVLQENPEVIVSGDRADQAGSGIDMWKQYPSMLAVRRGNLFAFSGDLFNRSGPRVIAGAAQLCDKLEQVRAKRGERQ